MKKSTLWFLVLLTLLINGGTSSPIQSVPLQRQLTNAHARGVSYRFIDNETIEFSEHWTGNTWRRSLREPSESAIRAWAAQRHIPILEIDPEGVDTNKYAGWYTNFTVVPLANGFSNPIVVADLDHNGKPECYGLSYVANSHHETRCYELDASGVPTLRHNYAPLQAASRSVVDVDRDSLKEVIFTQGGFVSDYGQPSPDSLPIVFQFEYSQYKGADPGYSGIFIGSLDGDSLTDFLYKGSDVDSTRVFVAEYNEQANNFVRVWSTNYGIGGVAGIGGFAVGDFDGDGRMEFVASESIYRRIYVTENVGDNDYAVTWQDTTPFFNLYHTISGDVDGDGKEEFFVGGDEINGNWTIAYEADSNDHYSARFMFHIAPDGFFSPTYLTSDVDGDGQPELVILSGGYLHVFKGIGDDRYGLWYFKHFDNTMSCQCYDISGDGRKDLLISCGINEVGLFTNVYTANEQVGVREQNLAPAKFSILRNYPNPFNAATSIKYLLGETEWVSLVVLDVLGQRIATLVDEKKQSGYHVIHWNAVDKPSGVYFCRLETKSRVTTIKLLLLR